MGELASIRDQLRAFTRERDWEQFHTPKNLSLALVGEVGELVSLFQWVESQDIAKFMNDPINKAKVRAEIADVFTYLVRLSDVLGIDLKTAFEQKLKETASRYTVERAKGKSEKIPRSEV